MVEALDKILDLIFTVAFGAMAVFGFCFVGVFFLALLLYYLEEKDGRRIGREITKEEDDEQMEYLRKYSERQKEKEKNHAGKQAGKLRTGGVHSEPDGSKESE